ncbi:hypothetical protein BZZ01_14070 [Nostocales cyanobacterium HT-58-2]|nr:hypothetical protein BZZ01_14070 [Nostocales cyanobacterium HT-58-2]
MTILFLVTFLPILSWQLLKIIYTNHQKSQKLKITIAKEQLQHYTTELRNLAALQEQNRIALNFYDAIGHSIAALNIQLQVAHKLWQVDPTQAQHSLSEAYKLSTILMQEVRQTVRSLNQENS